MAPECQEKNAEGLTMVAVGVNKSAEQYLILDEDTREELASGKYHDQRRGSFGPAAPRSRAGAAAGPSGAAAGPSGTAVGRSGTPARPAGVAQPARRRSPAARRPAARPAPRPPWTPSQQRLALLYNEQGLRPDEIAQKLGLSRYLVTQIILAARNRGKL
jgi:hypothetical protein